MSTASSAGGSGGASANCLDFLHCNKCFYPLSVIPNDSPHRPVSLTNCGHIYCGVCREKGVGSKGNNASCCVCSRTSIRSLKLESPMPDSVKRLFYNYVAEWEANHHWIEERRKVHASALRDIAKALEDIVGELSSSPFKNGANSGEAASLKKIAQTAKFQQDQWKSLARGYGGIFRKSREDAKQYQNELQNVRAALKESEEEKRKLEEKLRELQQQQQQQQQRRDHPRHHHSGRPTTSTPALFQGGSGGDAGASFNARSPFFRKNPLRASKHASAAGAGRENRDPLSEHNKDGQRRNSSPFDVIPPAQDRHGGGGGGGGGASDRMRFETPKIFSTGKRP